MQGNVFDYWQAIVGLVAIIGVWIAYRQWKRSGPKTTNTIRDGDRNIQKGGPGETVNTIKGGDDNQQSG